MVDLDWLESFEIGIPEIDDDHRAMLDLMKRVRAAALDGAFDHCGSLLEALQVRTNEHFEREEALLGATGYAGLEDQRAHHDELRSRVRAVRELSKAMQSREDLDRCCEEMFAVFVDEILGGDMAFKSFLHHQEPRLMTA